MDRRLGPANHVRDSAVQRLTAALLEQDRLTLAFHTAVGSSSEFGAYVRLQRAGEQVAARQAWLKWLDNASLREINAARPRSKSTT